MEMYSFSAFPNQGLSRELSFIENYLSDYFLHPSVEGTYCFYTQRISEFIAHNGYFMALGFNLEKDCWVFQRA